MNRKYETEIIEIEIGGTVTANSHAVDFNLTEDKKYIVSGFGGGTIRITNDLGVEDLYSMDYFKEF